MKLTKQTSEFGLNIFLEEERNYLAFTFGGNGDLYWSIHSEEPDVKTFIITKENYGVYSLFEKLYSDIENINIYELEEEYIPFFSDHEEEFEYLERRNREIEKDRERYRKYNYAHYNDLFDKETKTITWYSDETAPEVSNILKIIKEGQTFKLEFSIQPYQKGYDEDFHNYAYIPIRFRNSGSRYQPFNIVFMRMYNSMKEIDDIDDFGHQIHIEEYLYSKGKVKKLIKRN